MRLLRQIPRFILIPLLVLAGAAIALAPVPVGSAPGFSLGAKLPQLGKGHIWCVALDPAQPSTMLAGTDAGVYTSGDGGVTWSLTLPGPRVWTAGFDARNPALAFAGTNGDGIYSSADAGRTWQSSSTGLPNQDVRAMAFGLDGVAAATAAGVAVSPDGHSWHDAGLDGYAVSAIAVAANFPQFTLIAGADGGSLNGGYLFRSTGGGAWEVLQSGLPAEAVVSSLSAGPIDAAVPKRPLLAATSKGVYRSGDGGTTWTQSAGITDQVTATFVTYSPLDPSLAYAAADAGGSTGGDLFRSADSGTTFGGFDQGLPGGSKNVESLAVGATNPPTLLAALDPPGAGGALYLAIDATAPAPPALTAEAPGAPVPTAAATARPTPTPIHAPSRAAPEPASASGIQGFAAAAFHWPTPLVFEILFVLVAAYAVVRWRERYYVEGPP
ncbi:MAG: hypothetical protein E6J45_04445 [Chloroflexi bacterium]|nr:MAG: hypothetical protein E6J45_04445 [Chloroflexota bacterium]